MKTSVYIIPDSIKNDLLDIDRIRFSDISYKKLCKEATEEFKKETFIHFIDMYYKNNPIIIQLSKCKIDIIDDNKMIIHIDEEIMNYFIKPLEEHIINTVHTQSEKWFNGKKFTMNKIMNSLISPANKKNNIYTLKLTMNKNTLYFNKYKHPINKNDIIGSDIEIISLIKIANLQFLQNKFSYNIVLEQGKIFMDERLVEYSIIDEYDNNISDSISLNETCEEEYYQKSIDSDNHDFFLN